MPHGRYQAERHADQQREDQPADGKFDGHGQALDQDAADRPAEADRIAEIALQDAAHVEPELDVDGTVESVLTRESFADLLRCSLAENGLAGIARDRAGENEGDQEDTE